jgi:hypothetical protein
VTFVGRYELVERPMACNFGAHKGELTFGVQTIINATEVRGAF